MRIGLSGAAPRSANSPCDELATRYFATTCSVLPCSITRPRSSKMALSHSRRSARSEEHTSELQSLMRISYAVFCLKKKNTHTQQNVSTKRCETNHIDNNNKSNLLYYNTDSTVNTYTSSDD